MTRGRQRELAALTAGLLAVATAVATFLGWGRSGERSRTSYELVDAADRAGVLPESWRGRPRCCTWRRQHAASCSSRWLSAGRRIGVDVVERRGLAVADHEVAEAAEAPEDQHHPVEDWFVAPFGTWADLGLAVLETLEREDLDAIVESTELFSDVGEPLYDE